MKRIHGNYRRKRGKRSGRKPNWYVAIAYQIAFMQRVLNKWDARRR